MTWFAFVTMTKLCLMDIIYFVGKLRLNIQIESETLQKELYLKRQISELKSCNDRIMQQLMSEISQREQLLDEHLSELESDH